MGKRPKCRRCGGTDVYLYEEVGADAVFFDLTIEGGRLVTHDNGNSDGQPRYIRSFLVCACGHRWRTRYPIENRVS